MAVSIYALSHPVTGEVRYIGKANDPQARYKGHLREARSKTPVYCWIGSLRADGMAPQMEVIEVCEEAVWQERERFHIEAGRRNGSRLLNIADGGDEPHCDYATRAANGRANALARVSTEKKRRIYELKRNLAQLLKEGFVSEATKKKLRIAAERRPDLFGEYASL